LVNLGVDIFGSFLDRHVWQMFGLVMIGIDMFGGYVWLG